MARYLIVGGVAGGATTAARLRRQDEKAEIVMFERGAYISYANCGMPYYIGGSIRERDKLFVQTPESFNARFNIDIRINTTVTKIDRAAKTVTVKKSDGSVSTERYDKLVLSPGAEPLKPPLPGIDSEGIFTLRTVDDTDAITSFILTKKPKTAVIIGAGFIGMEMAENLHARGIAVTMLEMLPQVLAPLDYDMAALVHDHVRAKGVTLKLKQNVTGFSRTASGISIALNGGETIGTDMVLLSMGVRPESGLAKAAGLSLGERDAILVNEYMQTSDENIYALGDAVAFMHPILNKAVPTYLAGPANKQGRIVADNIVHGNRKKYAGSIGTAIAKVFDITVAMTGVSEKALAAAGTPHNSWIVHPASHASYYPDASQLSIKIVFAPDGKLYGAQIIGNDGADKRIDVIAAYLKTGGTVTDLAEFEQAYAPPYSSAKDPVNIAGFAAENLIDGTMKGVAFDKIASLGADTLLLDVRTKGEVARGTIPGAVHIPVDELRSRMGELQKDKKIVVYCAVGLRAYVAARMLMQNGYDAYNLKGGWRTYASAYAGTAH